MLFVRSPLPAGALASISRVYLAPITRDGRLIVIESPERGTGWTLPTAVRHLPRSRIDMVARRILTASVLTTDIVTTDIVTTDIVTTDIVTTDIVTTDIVTTDILSAGGLAAGIGAADGSAADACVGGDLAGLAGLRLIAVDSDRTVAIYSALVDWPGPMLAACGGHRLEALDGHPARLRHRRIRPEGIVHLLADAGTDLAAARIALTDIRISRPPDRPDGSARPEPGRPEAARRGSSPGAPDRVEPARTGSVPSGGVPSGRVQSGRVQSGAVRGVPVRSEPGAGTEAARS